MAPRIDWRALLKVEPDLPNKLNRAFFSVESESRALRALITDLQTEVDTLETEVDEIDVELPDVGTPGTYGGAPDFIEAITVDAKGRVTAVTEGEPAGSGSASTEGSVFSMTGPLGAAAPIVAYDFTRYDATDTVANNLIAANQSGDSSLDLVAVGGGRIKYQTASGDAGQTPFALTPLASHSEGGALLAGLGTDYAETSGSPAALQLLGAMTIEWFGFVSINPGAASCQLISFVGNGETENVNALYLIQWSAGTTALSYLHESGAGTDSSRDFVSLPDTEFGLYLSTPFLLTLTRAATTGILTLYINGRQAADPAAATAVALPTGGTASNLRIGQGGTTGKMAVLGVRIFDTVLTADQVRESYNRTMFGVAL